MVALTCFLLVFFSSFLLLFLSYIHRNSQWFFGCVRFGFCLHNSYNITHRLIVVGFSIMLCQIVFVRYDCAVLSVVVVFLFQVRSKSKCTFLTPVELLRAIFSLSFLRCCLRNNRIICLFWLFSEIVCARGTAHISYSLSLSLPPCNYFWLGFSLIQSNVFWRSLWSLCIYLPFHTFIGIWNRWKYATIKYRNIATTLDSRTQANQLF